MKCFNCGLDHPKDQECKFPTYSQKEQDLKITGLDVITISQLRLKIKQLAT
jgi:hypothetical protein